MRSLNSTVGSARLRPSLRIRRPGTPESWQGSCGRRAPAGNLTTDAHLAALAIEHGAEIVSYDRDFARFPGVRHRLPH